MHDKDRIVSSNILMTQNYLDFKKGHLDKKAGSFYRKKEWDQNGSAFFDSCNIFFVLIYVLIKRTQPFKILYQFIVIIR